MPTTTHEQISAASEMISEGVRPGDGPLLIEILTELAWRKWLIAKVTAAALFAGAILAFVLPVRYTATTEILPPRQTQSAAELFMSQIANSNAGALATMAEGGLGLKNPNDLYIGLLKSRPVADALIRQFDLEKVYHTPDMTAARATLADATAVISEKSGLLSVQVTDADRNRSAAIANAYTQQLRALTQDLAVTEAAQRRLFYEQQLKRARQDLVYAELAFQRVEQKKGVIQPEEQARALIENLTNLRAQVAAKQVEVQALRTYSTEHNPALQLAENQLTSLQAQVAQMEQRDHPAGPADLTIEEVPAAGREYLSAQRELLYRQTVYELLIKQYDAARLDESKEAAIIQVVAPALPPEFKSSPQRAVILLLFTSSGFFLSSMLAFALIKKEKMEANPSQVASLKALKQALCFTNERRSTKNC